MTTDIDLSDARVGGTRRGIAPGTEFTAYGWIGGSGIDLTAVAECQL